MNKVINIKDNEENIENKEGISNSSVLEGKINDITTITGGDVIKGLELSHFTLGIIDILKSRLPGNTPAEMISNNAKIRQILDDGQTTADDYYNLQNAA